MTITLYDALITLAMVPHACYASVEGGTFCTWNMQVWRVAHFAHGICKCGGWHILRLEYVSVVGGTFCTWNMQVWRVAHFALGITSHANVNN